MRWRSVGERESRINKKEGERERGGSFLSLPWTGRHEREREKEKGNQLVRIKRERKIDFAPLLLLFFSLLNKNTVVTIIALHSCCVVVLFQSTWKSNSTIDFFLRPLQRLGEMLNNSERENVIRTCAFGDAGRELAHTCKIQTLVSVIVFLSSLQPFCMYIDRPIDGAPPLPCFTPLIAEPLE